MFNGWYEILLDKEEKGSDRYVSSKSTAHLGWKTRRMAGAVTDAAAAAYAGAAAGGARDAARGCGEGSAKDEARGHTWEEGAKGRRRLRA